MSDDPAGPTKYPAKWTDTNTTRTTAWLAQKHDIIVPEAAVGRALEVVAEQKKVHPVRDWLESLTWDGKPRAEDWIIRFFGADNTPYVRTAVIKWQLGLVQRVYEPGCIFRMMLILESPQLFGKSSALRALASRDEWFL